MKKTTSFIILFFLFLLSNKMTTKNNKLTILDKKVKTFLNNHTWRNMNVPGVDGKTLYNLIIKHNYKRAVDIGTSTGHSAIWMAWALSKTGGKLITIEINRNRYKQALINFKKSGLSKYIDARLANAHTLVPKLKGRFDFAFCDADKGWYKNYFLAMDSKLKVGGCYVSHNVSLEGDFWNSKPYINFLKSLKNYKTVFDTKGSGMSISYKIR